MPESLAPPYRVSIATGAEGLRSLREAWLALERRVGTTRVAQTWRWHEAAATHLFDADAPPLYVQVRAGDITVALAALQAAGRLRFGPLSFGRLSSPAHPHLGLTDWLILPGTQAVPLVEGIIDALRSASLPRWTLLDVDRLPVNAAAFEVLRNVPGAIVQPHGQSAWFDCSRGTPDTAIPKRMRRNLRRLRARAREAGPVRASSISLRVALMSVCSAVSCARCERTLSRAAERSPSARCAWKRSASHFESTIAWRSATGPSAAR